MGPQKGIRKEVPKRENGANNLTIEDPINSSSWRCAVIMAVEKTSYDSFVLKEFMEECSSGRRQEVSHIDFDTFVMKLLNGFANGELPYTYAFLLKFSSVFQEAVDFISQKMDVPVLVLVKVVKALLFYLREESLTKIEKIGAGLPDPIKAMAERQTNFSTTDTKKKEITKKGDNGLKVRPPSVTKQDTELLKRGEKAKDDQRIDDAPQNAYFNLYVLLTGFYNPDFPLELIKAGVPLHALLCIDTSLSGVKRDASFTRSKFHKRNSEARSQEIQNFWNVFLKMLWDPKESCHFKDTIFQVYLPQRLLCEKKKLREFIYREISFLMYDLSDLKRQLNNYLDHMTLWNVTEEFKTFKPLGFENLPNECVSVPIILQYIIDAICGKDKEEHTLSTRSINSAYAESEQFTKNFSASVQAKFGSCAVSQSWHEELEERGDFNLLNVYYKTKELDEKYDLDSKGVYSLDSEKTFAETGSSRLTCHFQPGECGKNMEEALLSLGGIFRSYWMKHQKDARESYGLDYCMYSFLMTKLFCPYQINVEAIPARSYHSIKKNSNFEMIENLSEEMRKPHFTVTDGSRSILKSVPYNVKNISRNFFCPEQFKIVSPEKLKASSAPEFRTTPSLKVKTLFTSEIFHAETHKNPFESLRGFVDEFLFSNTNDFDFLEFFSKSKLLEKEHEHWDNYNCIDQTYCLLNDCIFLMLHNRKNYQSIHHETFNEMLRSTVGLRDFYEYVLEDEFEWLAVQEELYQTAVILANKMLESNSFRNFSESDFWLVNSLKYQRFDRSSKEAAKDEEVKIEYSGTDEMMNKPNIKHFKNISLVSQTFEGYDVSDMTVQFSGLKTVFYSNDCSVSVQLVERLYGSQELGIHVTAAASHALHLYSYVCPEPHIIDPFTFHLTFKNGIIIAFGRRFLETFEEVEEIIESRTVVKGRKNSSELSTRVVKKQIPRTVKDKEFLHDMTASLPNGLFIRTRRRIVKPCYIKQSYLANSEENHRLESSRLFLPNGNVVKMMSDGTIQILKVDASIVTASLNDFVSETASGHLSFSKFEIISGEGYANVFEQAEMTSSKRFHIFQNTDVDTGQIFFRRRDGTNYMLQNDGTFCVQFKDGTKLSSSVTVLVDSPKPSLNNAFDFRGERKVLAETDPAADFVFVHMKIVAEHPDYATVTYDMQNQEWEILLPYDSTIKVGPQGYYSVEIDRYTELKVEEDFVRMNSYSSERQPQCSFTADLSVFENKEKRIYCQMEDSDGKIFVVEDSSNCYILNEELHSQNDFQEGSSLEFQPQDSEISEFVASADLQTCPSIRAYKGSKLFRENKYFVIKRDLTGVQVLHVDDVSKELTKTNRGTLVFTQNIPGTENRCFVLITPKAKQKIKKWTVDTILPNPKYEPGTSKKTTSSTYGVPPSWMHPFPKRKIKFVIPQLLTCRVFLETRKTELTPPIGAIDCYNCEMDEITEIKHSHISPGGMEEYLKKLSNDDQDMLKEMYSLAAASLINKKKNSQPTNSKKLESYLEMSRRYVELRESHKKYIRYRIVPNYFQHPAGMSWLILNDLLKLKLPHQKKIQKQVLHEKDFGSDRSLPFPESAFGFSNEEIEFNLSVSPGQSFSDLSYRSNLSARTAPEVLTTGDVCRCQVKVAKDVVSAPAIRCCLRDQTYVEENFTEPHSKACEIQESDIEMMAKKNYKRETSPMTLEDLMHLGLI